MNIQLPPIILPDVAQPRVPETVRQELQPMQKVTAVVEAALGDNLYLLRFGNKQTQARSDQPLRPGSTVELQVQNTANAQVLKLLESPQHDAGSVTLRTALCQLMPRIISQSEWQKTLAQWSGPVPEDDQGYTSTGGVTSALLGHHVHSPTPNANVTSPANTAAGPLARAILESFPEMASLGNADKLRESVLTSGLFWDQKQMDGQSLQGMPDDLKGRLLQLIKLLQASIDGVTRPGMSSPHVTSLAHQGLRSPAEWPGFLQGLRDPSSQFNATVSAEKQATGDAMEGEGQQSRGDNLSREAELLQHLETLDDATVESLSQQIDLLRKTEGSLAQLVMHQISSQTSSNETQIWRMDIPYRDPKGQPQTMQLEIQRERHAATDASILAPTWRIDIRISPPALGPLHGQLTLCGDRVDAVLWSQQPSTTSLLNTHLDMLKAKLSQAGLDVRSIKAMQGTPTSVSQHGIPGQNTLGQSLIDERA